MQLQRLNTKLLIENGRLSRPLAIIGCPSFFHVLHVWI
jgi:hypothetical protein